MKATEHSVLSCGAVWEIKLGNIHECLFCAVLSVKGLSYLSRHLS